MPTAHYTARCLLDCDYIKNHFRLITGDSRRRKELDVHPKVVKKITMFYTVKKIDGNDNATDAAVNDQSVILTILKRIKETRLKCSQGSVTVL